MLLCAYDGIGRNICISVYGGGSLVSGIFTRIKRLCEIAEEFCGNEVKGIFNFDDGIELTTF